ncbi:MAG: site-2 protease family protein [Gammaproteobacteria bacterium]|nr:site-2 protease family protein [Gammaproteobacteria bacterium]
MALSTIQYIAAAIIPVLFAITLHEVAHGFVANRLGDPSAKMLGRLTLNPLKHIDLVGTIIVPALLLAVGGFVFGWAKPVPVNSRNLKNPSHDMIWVAAAGPAANGVMALCWAAILKISILFFVEQPLVFVPIKTMAQIGIQINLILLALNLVPIPPLDGSKILMGLLPGPMAYRLSLLEPYGFFIVLALLYFGILGAVLEPVLNLLFRVISGLFGF